MRSFITIAQRVVKAGMVALVVVLAMNCLVTSAAAQDPAMFAQQACEKALKDKMRQETNARNPDVAINYRSAQLRQISNFESGLRGDGTFSRDGNDRNREFSFNCVINIRDGYATKADYNWKGGSRYNQDEDRGYENQSYGRDYSNRGRVWFSGGVINVGSGKGLDVQDRATWDAGNVQQWSFADQPNQKWDVIDLGDGQYSIINQASNRALEVAGKSDEDGANVQQFRFHNGDNQRWLIKRSGGGNYQIVNVYSGKCLDVAGKSSADGANIQQWSCSGASNQAWKFGR